jgi:hypothetical protein
VSHGGSGIAGAAVQAYAFADFSHSRVLAQLLGSLSLQTKCSH